MIDGVDASVVTSVVVLSTWVVVGSAVVESTVVVIGSVVVFVAPGDGSAVAVDDPLAVVIAVESTATYSFLLTTILGPVNVPLTAFY